MAVHYLFPGSKLCLQNFVCVFLDQEILENYDIIEPYAIMMCDPFP